jgi:phosphoribosylformylglycinamidine synthase
VNDGKTNAAKQHHRTTMPQVLIIRAPGTNCDQETAHAFQLAGATHVEIIHLNRILETPAMMDWAEILCIPGGFSFGDDIAAGKIFASKMKNRLADAFKKFRDDGKLILGICNGFQVLLKSGLLFDDHDVPVATLTWNHSAMYIDRWVHLQTEESDCVFLRGVRSMYLPIAHAEGRFVINRVSTSSPSSSVVVPTSRQLALKYISGDNPNGSMFDVAGVCDISGRVFGLMPHPERHINPLQHPHWTRKFSANSPPNPPTGDGLVIFQNAIDFFRK